jgi:hypothetical protein
VRDRDAEVVVLLVDDVAADDLGVDAGNCRGDTP